MASKVSAGVSYGIGVQNRYSAFLEDEDGILLPPASMKRTTNESQVASAGSKQKGSNNTQRQSQKQMNGKNETSSNSSNKRTTEAQQNKNLMNGQQAKQVDVRRQQQQQPQQQQQRNDKAHGVAGVKSAQTSRQNYATGRASNFNHESGQSGGGDATNPKYHHRNPMNRNFSHPSSNASHQHNNSSSNSNNVNKENDSSPGFNNRANNNNQRFNRQRQYQSRDERRGPQAQADGQLNSHAAPISEEEKRRRQQKRALDLKFKDPEKGAARRQQAATNGVGAGESANEVGGGGGVNEADESGQRGMRNNKRPGGRPDEAGAGRNMRGPGGFRGARSQEGGGAAAGGGQDRPQRSRNGFGTGSRNSNQGSRGGDTRNQERARPIPNFSDKSDFPSLAS